jgi:fructose-specific phosphotransferase system IIC component
VANVHRVRRIIRKIDAWTVFKISAIVWSVVALAMVLGLVMFWSVLDAARIPDRITEFLIEITLLSEGSDPFGDNDAFLRLAIFGSISFSVLGCGVTTLLAVMYNLASDVVGGVEIVVLEETLAPVPAAVPAPAPSVRRPALTTADLPTEETPITTPERG